MRPVVEQRFADDHLGTERRARRKGAGAPG
jgi:hypothetical protein